jgi:hypothetical protein
LCARREGSTTNESSGQAEPLVVTRTGIGGCSCAALRPADMGGMV